MRNKALRLLIDMLHRYLYHHVVQKFKILLSRNTIYSCFSNFLWDLAISFISLCCIFIFSFLTWLIAHLSPWNLFSSPNTLKTLIRPWYSKETVRSMTWGTVGMLRSQSLAQWMDHCKSSVLVVNEQMFSPPNTL